MRSLLAMAAVAVLVAAGCGGDNEKPSPNRVVGGSTGAQEPSAGGATGPSGPTGKTRPRTPSGADRTRTKEPKKRATLPPNLKRKRGSSTPRGAAELTKVERYLRDTYGGIKGAKAPWYDRITRVSVSGETTTVETDLDRDREGRRLAGEICQSVIGSVPGSTDVVRVTGPVNLVLVKCVP